MPLTVRSIERLTARVTVRFFRMRWSGVRTRPTDHRSKKVRFGSKADGTTIRQVTGSSQEQATRRPVPKAPCPEKCSYLTALALVAMR